MIYTPEKLTEHKEQVKASYIALIKEKMRQQRLTEYQVGKLAECQAVIIKNMLKGREVKIGTLSKVLKALNINIYFYS